MPRIISRHPALLSLVIALSGCLAVIVFTREPYSDSSSSSSLKTASSHAIESSSESNGIARSTSQLQKATTSDSPITADHAADVYGRLPLSFEINRGQSDKRAKFFARGQGYGLSLTSTGAVLSLQKRANKQAMTDNEGAADRLNPVPARERVLLEMRLQGADPSPQISGDDKLPGNVNYFVGNDRSKWRTNIETYSKVRYRGVYPGTDLVYYGNQRQLEYDFVVAPGADPGRIKLSFTGAEEIRIDQNGNLILSTPAGEVIQHKPVAYQDVDGERREVSAVYRLEGDTIKFDLGSYDKTDSLTIDPVLVYSTFTGGSDFGGDGRGIAVDAQGNAFLAGSIEFLNASSQIIPDAFVIKLNPAGSAAVYTTYVGGSGFDAATSIAIDAQNNAYITGITDSSDFPVTAGAFQETKEFGSDGFVTKLNPSGSTLTYSTFLGGDNTDNPFGIAVSGDGRAHVVGNSDSTRLRNIPVTRQGSPVYKSTDSAANWSASATGMNAASVVGFAQHAGNSNIVYAATNIGVFKSTNAGANWSITGTDNPATAPKVTAAVVVDPSNANIIYAATTEGIHKSSDGGATYALKNTGLFTAGLVALAIDPITPTTLYAGTFLGVYKTTDGGDNWVDMNFGLGQAIVLSIAIDPITPANVYVGTSNRVFKSTNNGASWSPLPVFIAVFAIAIDPVDPLKVYAATAANVVRSTDGGDNFSAASTGLPLGQKRAIAIDRTTPSTLYVAVPNAGVFKSTNSGTNWSESNVGLANLAVFAVAVDLNSPAIVYAGTTIGGDAFAVRLDPSGSALEYVLTFGGNELDEARGVALDSSATPYVVGSTSSQNYPVTNAFQATSGGSRDAFVAKLNATGSGFLYNTYLGGSGAEQGRAIAVRQDKAYVVGSTTSTNYPVVNAFQPAIASTTDAFLTTFNSAGSALEFSTYFGGGGTDQALAVVLDSIGNVYITGSTASANLPTMNPTQPAFGGSSQDAFVTTFNSSATALVFSTYLGGSAFDQGNGIAVDSLGSAYVIGTSSSSNFPTVNPIAPFGLGGSFVTKIGGIVASSNVQFAAAQFAAGESDARVLIDVSRTGDASAAATVDYQTSDTAGLTNCNVFNGIASSRCDYATSLGVLRFAAGETSKTISIPIVDDAYAEGSESFTITLSNATGASLGSPATATVTINDNEVVNGANPIDQTAFFVRQQYVDFLGREPDPPGFAAWQAVINNCPPNDTSCDRIHVSSGFFRSPEFQERGYFVYRFYPVAFGRKPGFDEFIPDLAKVSGFLSDAELEAARVAFIAEFMNRPAFVTKYNGLDNTQYVDTLLSTAQITHPNRAAWIAALDAGTKTRAQVLREIAESTEVFNKYFNQAFVVMQYFGYLQREPDALYLDWIAHLDSTNDFRSMINGFMNSLEYRFRFGP